MESIVLYFWVILGLLLILAELLIPGLVVVFLGLGALIVALGIGLGWLSGWMPIMTTWFISSLILIFSLRNLFARFAPGDTEVGNMDEDLEAMGRLVEVVKDVHPHNEEGRIMFRGTTWQARCPHGTLQQGAKARLVRREMNLWIVEPAE